MSDEADDPITLKWRIAKEIVRRRDVEARLSTAERLLERAVKYATEDRAVTPGSTRLERLVAEVRAFLTPETPPKEGT